VIAHIGNVPVEEWLPFLVPVVALYVYGRHRSRRRRAALEQLPDAGLLLDERMLRRVMARWSAAGHSELSAQLVPLLYPPGPDGLTAAELASRVHLDRDTVEHLLEELAELGYADLEESDADTPRAWLTISGHDLLALSEDELLDAARERGGQPP
jgi:DNA-binding transcriptional ArsR family regulator